MANGGRSLVQMLAAQADPTAGQNVLTQVQQGVQTGLQLATLEDQVNKQRDQAKAQKLQVENQQAAFLEKGFNQIKNAASDSAAKRKAKLFQQSAARAGIQISDDFLADASEQRDRLGVILKGLAEIQTNPNINPEQKSEILQQAFQQIQQDGSFSEVFTAAQGLARMQATQAQRQEVRAEKREFKLSQQLVKTQNDFEKRVKGERSRLEGVTSIKSLLEAGGPISQNVAQFQIARLAQGAGVLTDKDVQRLGGSRALKNRIESFVSTITEGKPLTPSDTKELLEIVNLFDQRLNEQLQTKAESFARGRSKALGETEERILEVLDVAPRETAATLAEGAPEGSPPPPAADPLEDFIATEKLSPEQAQALRAAAQQAPVVQEEPIQPPQFP